MTDDVANLPERVPYHVAIIMDGNGRWAKARGLPRVAGHRAGVENLRRILRASSEFGIKILTIYAFSTENWGRPEAEVRGLMNILETVIDRELDQLHANGVQLRHIGEIDGLSPVLQRKVRKAVDLTRNNDQLILNIAFNYGGRQELVRAIQQIVRDGIPVDEIDETLIDYYLYTTGQPDPDLVVRTAGEMRLSNFLLWQASYAEYYSTPVYWPDFDRGELLKAISSFGHRERRYGLVPQP
ncbi:MAG TPA: isoprenyl transferase [Aggregatilinea sp.]|uniref:isoprenyl transferase n=1 Tax=Aggregatilinea sp. TaxID=2806333 RepID=UPI002D1C3A09|nr:isoprenyl transferase [Aggregatilinea sp.]HML25059.1 isoprenyl transferase [Aggregatilinea sp.]